MTTQAYGANAADQPLQPLSIERRTPGRRTSRSRSRIAGSVTRTFTRSAPSGMEHCSRACLVTRLSAR